ncbi:MAG TPA: SDR family NAD(P)-dependent oxidoreductase [Gordonia sp. (in: high G+C Gram-positive bacteria)]|mgnify:FL=1|uniref:SDR family NAD(P)-dependent oxidoreductase n=1 Tax=unclassified Gordonia (in: high G+C Gram-positive bacteria) TaxID=2657482 RepID=UPI000FABEE4C|nr:MULTISPECIES: SDR family NAD(P)-dependent oxidoreductase [unclassified Gordonia (in: high G+C Gram-positive bacteria)]RUP37786.1 MAG: SDR family NAD(P)-dependent oxidoreductase [Gordonia sp. (in: high G+C Gram-positive bacteria)]HNP55358.1 SDR family NAD(P)-dependent oxidoreductase [Gordonia sp. (in: high G+C Gram-positive bacteria)]HRC50070.1 SDR family NAD(P)-dependent oxidoreductase [Gordonia sp. (in: high G+C Gram-positive bacteria)]
MANNFIRTLAKSSRTLATRAALQRAFTVGDLTDIVAPIDLSGKKIVVTGASSGIGEEAARQLAAEGATVILVARGIGELERVASEISAGGGSAFAVSGDLSTEKGVGDVLDAVLTRFGTPDIIVNNAGRSIRRSVADSTGRMHDFQRTMAINYFGPIGLTLGVLDEFLRRDSGQFINVCTWGVTNGSMPRFAAYAASKAALAAFGRSLAAELLDTGVSVTNVCFPLVNTPMIAPTAEYERVPSLSAHDAGEWIVYAAKHRPLEIMPRYARALRGVTAISASWADGILARGVI